MKQHPMENAIWWLEYLSETKCANHLKLSSRHLNLVQYFSLDFFTILVLILISLWKLMKLIILKNLNPHWNIKQAKQFWCVFQIRVKGFIRKSIDMFVLLTYLSETIYSIMQTTIWNLMTASQFQPTFIILKWTLIPTFLVFALNLKKSLTILLLYLCSCYKKLKATL